MQNTSFLRDIRTLGLVGLAASIGTYYMDPNNGRRRRALLRDKIGKSRRLIRRQSELALRDMENRLQGRMHELLSLFATKDADEGAIRERVKAVIGHYVSNSGAIHVSVSGNVVNLSGSILRREVLPLLWAVRTVKGVKHVNNNLTVYDHVGESPDLHGEARRPAILPITREYWPPAYRMSFGVLGLGMMVYGMAKRDLSSLLTAGAGGLLLTRSIMNKSLARIFGIAAGPHVIYMQKSISIKVPVDKVYEVWANPENFPKFMQNVRRVEKVDEGKYIWTVKGPASSEIQWTAMVTEAQENKRIRWVNLPDSVVEHAGQVYFEDHGDSTVIHIHLAYNPPAGALGHLIAYLFRSDPKTDLDEDMLRLKNMLESERELKEGFTSSAAS